MLRRAEPSEAHPTTLLWSFEVYPPRIHPQSKDAWLSAQEGNKWQGGNGQSRSTRNLRRKDLEFQLTYWFEMLCVVGDQRKVALYRCRGDHGIPSPQTVS